MMIFPVEAAPNSPFSRLLLSGEKGDWSDRGDLGDVWDSDLVDLQILKEKMLRLDPVMFHFEACDANDVFFFDIKAISGGASRVAGNDLFATEAEKTVETAETAETAKAAETAATAETAGATAGAAETAETAATARAAGTTPAADPRNPRKGAKQLCSICKRSGHKKRTCQFFLQKN